MGTLGLFGLPKLTAEHLPASPMEEKMADDVDWIDKATFWNLLGNFLCDS